MEIRKGRQVLAVGLDLGFHCVVGGETADVGNRLLHGLRNIRRAYLRNGMESE